MKTPIGELRIKESNGNWYCVVGDGPRPLMIQMDPLSDFCSCPTNRGKKLRCMHLLAYDEQIAAKAKES